MKLEADPGVPVKAHQGLRCMGCDWFFFFFFGGRADGAGGG